MIKKIYGLLTRDDRKLFYSLVFVVVFASIIDVAGIASIMPFMAVVGNPSVVMKNDILHTMYDFFGCTSANSFLILLGALVFLIILFSNFMKATILKLELNFVHLRLYSISRRLLFSYLVKPYSFYIENNAAILCKNILQEVSQFSHNVLRPCVQIVSKFLVVFFIVTFLFFVDPLLATIITAVLGGAYVLIYRFVQRKLATLGEERFSANASRARIATETFGGIKELKVLNRERCFFDRFSYHALRMEANQATSNMVSQLPSYIMECLTFGGILIIVMYFLIVKRNLDHTLPIMALYAFSGYRLMPALQGMFLSLTLLRFNLSVVNCLVVDLQDINEVPESWQISKIPALPFKHSISLSSITFQYPTSKVVNIENFNLVIDKNSNVGLIGSTGSGKSTIVDILLGLLIPQQGEVLVDGIPITSENIGNWQRNVGYVPQSIYLCDDTLASNIALGIPNDQIDYTSVERAARIANLHAFITEELPQGYQTIVGEHGVRLSGGQRQRIGIARALYHDPQVLILDEATSSLDGVTENAVMEALQNLIGQKTILAIAHRLTTLKDCDLIYVLDHGQVVEKGTFVDLSRSSKRFQAMARSGKSR